jgi:hypothetical protein
LRYVVTALELGEIRFFELEAHSLIEVRATAVRELRRSMKAGQVFFAVPLRQQCVGERFQSAAALCAAPFVRLQQ